MPQVKVLSTGIEASITSTNVQTWSSLQAQVLRTCTV